MKTVGTKAVEDKNYIHISCPLYFSHKLYDFQDSETVDSVLSTGSNQMNAFEFLVCVKLFEAVIM
jgi:hypothetical protein